MAPLAPTLMAIPLWQLHREQKKKCLAFWNQASFWITSFTGGLLGYWLSIFLLVQISDAYYFPDDVRMAIIYWYGAPWVWVCELWASMR